MSLADNYTVPQPAGVLTAAVAAGTAHQFPGACPHCSGPHSAVFHGGPCPRIKAVEYYPDGSIKRVEYHGKDEQPCP